MTQMRTRSRGIDPRTTNLPEGSFRSSPESREQIIQQEGETVEQFFERLWSHYHIMIFRMVWYRTHNTWAAQDIVSQTYLRALVSIKEKGTLVDNVRAWLCRIARNLTVDYFRHFYDTRLGGSFMPLDDMLNEPYNGLTNQLTLGRFLDIIIIRRALQLLKLYYERWYDVITKVYLEGYKFAELALEMDLTVGAVKAMQHRAFDKLRELVGEIVIEEIELDPVLDAV